MDDIHDNSTTNFKNLDEPAREINQSVKAPTRLTVTGNTAVKMPDLEVSGRRPADRVERQLELGQDLLESTEYRNPLIQRMKIGNRHGKVAYGVVKNCGGITTHKAQTITGNERNGAD